MSWNQFKRNCEILWYLHGDIMILLATGAIILLLTICNIIN